MNARRLAFQRLFITGISLVALLSGVVAPVPVLASHTADPSSVTIAGSFQQELGCPGDWLPDCAITDLTYDATDVVWQGTWNVPTGSWEYKAALNDSWDESYGKNGTADNIPLTLGAATSVKFYYDHKSHWITDNKNSRIATAPGSYQSEIGCPGDWQPDCLRSWLQDPDGNGIYMFSTTDIPQGNYEFKVAINEGWDESYGNNGANIPFSVPAAGYVVTFNFNSATNTPGVNITSPGPQPDNNVEWDGLRHDSRDTLYRTPGGAVPAGTAVTIRFRTFHNDVTGVKARFYSLEQGGQQIIPMDLAASDVSCYQVGLESETCDFWSVTLTDEIVMDPDNLWYRFIITDGSDTDYYADNTPALDGGLGSTSDDPIDNSYALMIYKPGFTAPSWATSAVIYQIFPDRFRDGRSANNAKTGDVRYDDPVLALPWGTLPEGYCRNYADGATNCPWRFDGTPPPSSPDKEQPRGRDYMGGDLAGVTLKLDYLKNLGVNTIYFNPIFDAGSNHSYDTQDYYTIDPYFGTQGDFQKLVIEARKRGIRIVLDGVFNHMSSDSPFFDRYQHYDTVGACESLDSPYRDWFVFRNDNVPCGTGDYEGWFGFDSIPVLKKDNAEVQTYFLTGQDSVSRYWLHHGAGGWRLDVSGDPSFPAGYWATFRQVTKMTRSDALLISETWQKDSTLLRMLRGDRLDTTMNYRLRDAVIGLLAPGNFDPKGFADSGHPIEPSEFASRLSSIREDYPDAAYYSLMNLIDSHDTERALWTLTPGSETTADKEQNASNLAAGKQRLQLASLIQFTVPGAPTVYYGDEVGITGDDDPDDRRTYPWADLGGSPDNTLFAHYQVLSGLRRQHTALTAGDFRVLLADDTADTVAYGRKSANQAAIVFINRTSQARAGEISVAGYLRDGLTFTRAYVVGTGDPNSVTVSSGKINVSLGPLSAVVLLTGNVDLMPPNAPSNLHVTNEGDGEVGLAWSAVPGAAGYNVYRSPLSGGGYIQANTGPITGTSFTDTGLQNAQTYYFVVRALDSAGNESGNSNEVSALPHYTIGWANLQWPPTMNHTISTINRTDNAYGQVWIDGVTNEPGVTEGLRAQLGFGPDGSNPASNTAWVWVEATFNGDAGNNDEFVASLLPEAVGTYDYAYRYSTTNGRDWVYADLDGIQNGYSLAQSGSLTVNSSGDTTAPATPAGLHVISASPDGVQLAWDAVTGDPTLYGYEVRRSDTSGGPYTTIATVTGTSLIDTSVVQGATYYYVVRALDTSFNRSGNSNEATATAELRTVTLVFNVTVPASTDGTGRSVYIAGTLSRLDGGLPDWDPGGVVLTRMDATTWTITLTGKETTQIAYKFTLGDWDHVEKDAACDEIADRQLTLSYGATGTQTVNVTVSNWRNVAPCGN